MTGCNTHARQTLQRSCESSGSRRPRKMSRRKQANPRPIKVLGEAAVIDPEPTNPTCEFSLYTEKSEQPNEGQENFSEFTSLSINTSNPTSIAYSPPPSDTLCDSLENQLPTLRDSPVFDSSFSRSANSQGEVPTPLLLSSVSSPPSPCPSTPSSLTSGSGALDNSGSRQRRGKKIMPVAGTDGRTHWQCPICQEEFTSDHDLTVHIRSHNTAQSKQPNTCTICGKVLSSQSSLDRHMLVHSGERPFKCKVCKMTFTTNGNMHRHSRIHAKEELKAAQNQLTTSDTFSKSTRSAGLSSTASAGKLHLTSARDSERGKSSKKASSKSSWHCPQPYGTEEFNHNHSFLKDIPSGIDLHNFVQLEKQINAPFSDFSRKLKPELQDAGKIELKPSKPLAEESLDLSSAIAQLHAENVEQKVSIMVDKHKMTSVRATAESSGDCEETAIDLTISSQQSTLSHKPGKVRNFHDNSHRFHPYNDLLHHEHQQSQDEVQCQTCSKTFLSDYGLTLHKESHQTYQTDRTAKTHNADGHSIKGNNDRRSTKTSGTGEATQACTDCKEVFTSLNSLQFHSLFTHSQLSLLPQDAVSPVIPSALSGKNGISKLLEAAPPGFSDLDFIDFTTDKFTLVAKAWCEQSPRRSSSSFHNFSCIKCSCSFPSRSALVLHAASHRPENWTVCPLCECYFVSTDHLHMHMQKHTADRAMYQSLNSDCSANAGKPDSMKKGDFLAMFGLVSKDDINCSHTNEVILESISKEQNNQYFAQLGDIPKIRQKSQEQLNASSKNNNKNLENLTSDPDLKSLNQTPSTPTSDDSTKPSSTLQPLPSKMSSIVSSEALPGMICPSPTIPVFLSMSSPSLVNADLYPSSLSPAGAFSMLYGSNSCMFPSPPISGSSTPSTCRAVDDVHDSKHQNIFACKYCGQHFSNYRAQKVHTRIHLGLSPYKCNLCNYSSADKSTLIRHLRTHNGERPFQCLICDYAFTTKANCERHVRKKHEKTEKEEIEKAITYNKYTTDLSAALENFHSPDTVCKYCGRDFKFFRALKHHLRSHSSCRQKPFMCTKCQVGFSMKANCIRHIQKQHLDVSQFDIEQFIHVNELSPSDQDIENDFENDDMFLPVGDDVSGSPTSTSSLPPSLMSLASAPCRAHSTPVVAQLSDKLSPNGLTRAVEIPEPLDFSLKNPIMAAQLSNMLYPVLGDALVCRPADTIENPEQPIDLTVKRKSPSPSSAAVVLPPSKGSSHFTTLKQDFLAPIKGSAPPQVAPLPCGLCQKTLHSVEELAEHMQSVHQIPPNNFSSDTFPTSDSNNNNTSTLLGTFMHIPVMTQLTSFLQKIPVANFPTHPAFPPLQQKLAFLKKMHPTLMSVMTALKTEPGGNVNSSGSDSGSDLASVNKILDATDAQKFQAFLNPNPTSSVSDDSNPTQRAAWESADDDSDQSLDQLYTQSLNGNAFKTEPNAEQANDDDGEDNYDDDAGEEINNLESSLEYERRNQHDSDISELSGGENALLMTSEALDSSGTSSGHTSSSEKTSKQSASRKSEGGITPAKKKRNSYADSPHKLNCPYCPRSFPWVSSLNRHLLTHTGQKPFKCPRCPVTFSTKSNRERHLIRKHGVNMLDPASRQTMDRPYKCHLCVFSSFSTESNLLKHYRERHPGCNPPECYSEKTSEGDGYSESAGGDIDLDSIEAISESNMDSNLTRASDSVKSMDGIVEGYTNKSANLIIPKLEDILMATSIKKEPEDLAQSLTNINSIEDEDNIDEDSNDTIPNQSSDHPFSAFSPSTPFNGSGERHINPERDNYNVDKITHCWKCGDQFHSRKLLVRHLKEHNIDLPFKCYLCDASYDSRGECLNHQEKHHAADWSILKDKNGVDAIDTFSDRLDRIVERNCKTGQYIEEGDEIEVGDDAQGDIVASDYLQRKVYCSLCAKRFWSLQDLRRHMRSHTGERPFECDRCQKRFTLKHSMMRHRRKHTGNSDSPTILSDDEDSLPGDSCVKAPAAHGGSGHKALRQHLAAVALKSSPTASVQISKNINGSATPSRGNDKDDDNGEDILHNLLGVESATIDQIIDSKDSAASLLGVIQK